MQSTVLVVIAEVIVRGLGH